MINTLRIEKTGFNNLVCAFVLIGFIGSCQFSGCTYGPKTKEKTLLESLDGKHYETGSPVVLTVPTILKRRRASVSVSGRVTWVDGSIPFPLVQQELILVQGSAILARVRTKSDGSFEFLGDFPDGEASVELVSEKYQGTRAICIHGFRTGNIDIEAKSK